MNNSPSYRILSLVLALLMFGTSIGFSVDLHFCNGQLKSFSLIGEAQSCHTVKKSCPHHANMEVSDTSKKDCCSNETFELEDLDSDFNFTQAVQLSDLQLKFVTSLVYSFFYTAPPAVANSSFVDRRKTIPPRDIYVLLERFLI